MGCGGIAFGFDGFAIAVALAFVDNNITWRSTAFAKADDASEPEAEADDGTEPEAFDGTEPEADDGTFAFGLVFAGGPDPGAAEGKTGLGDMMSARAG